MENYLIELMSQPDQSPVNMIVGREARALCAASPIYSEQYAHAPTVFICVSAARDPHDGVVDLHGYQYICSTSQIIFVVVVVKAMSQPLQNIRWIIIGAYSYIDIF